MGAGTVRAMYALARLLQLVGLVILPLAIIAQLNNSIDVRQLYRFLFFSIGIFCAGYLLQRMVGGQ